MKELILNLEKIELQEFIQKELQTEKSHEQIFK